MYSRGGGKIGSCGFEHVFMNEIKNNEISGLHNWIYFHKQEQDSHHDVDYKGYMKSLHLGNVSFFLFNYLFHFGRDFNNIDSLAESTNYQIPCRIQKCK